MSEAEPQPSEPSDQPDQSDLPEAQSDLPAAPPPPPSYAAPTPASYQIPPGQVKIRSAAAVVIYSFITLGIYHLYWIYQVFRELKETTREGIGPVVGLIIGILVGFVNWFVLPAEIGVMYEREGKAKPVSGLTGFWNFIPLVGTIIWIVKVQNALNDEWASLGVQPES